MLLCRNVFFMLRRLQSSKITYFSMENFLPSRQIRGMKILDKELFVKNIKVPCILIKNINNLKEITKILKPYLLKMLAFKSVRFREENCKEILLNPNIVESYDDLTVEDRLALSNFGEVNFELIEVKLTYDNWKASEILNAIIPTEIGSVSGYSIIGHIVHLNLKSELSDYKTIIGQVLLDKVHNARTVVNKVNNIENEFRTFQLEVLAGDSDFIVQVTENKCLYKFDFSKVYWNPRLSTEHLRVVENLKTDDYLYDAFAGVGPFTIPAAKKGCTVLANDLNGDAINYLQQNLRLNKVKKFVPTTIKDAGKFIREDFKQHFIKLDPGSYKVIITMNLPALATTFLPNFKGLYRPEDLPKLKQLPVPEVFVYCFIKDETDVILSSKKLVCQHLSMELDNEIKSVNFVRNVAPNKEMMRVIIALTPRILISQKRPNSCIEEVNTLKKSNYDFLSQDK